MRFADFPFLRYFPFIILGVCWGNSKWSLDLITLSILVSLVWFTYFITVSILHKRKSVFQPTLLAYIALVGFGALLVQNKESQSSRNSDLSQMESYLGEVSMYDQEKPNSFENLLEVKSVLFGGKWTAGQGKVLIYHQNDKPLQPGQVLLVEKVPQQIAAPRNPHEFDYKQYLSKHGIYYRQFLGKDFLVIDTASKTGIDYFMLHLRNDLGEMLKSKIPDENSSQIALALLLGQKKQLDPNIREAYMQAGVMHILAVSGLHVGIIYALFVLILKPLNLRKEKARIYLFFVILIIWLYAFLTGFSPSVVRAATMFSLITLGQMRERPPSIYNVLAFSAILMVTFNPDVIYEVGFQLSYLAVLGIVMIQPLIINLWLPPHKVYEYIWQLSSVSIAAQLVTFPLSIFYFHLFPTYFLLGNLLILPLVFIIMQVGVPLMIFGWIPVVGDVLGWVLSWLIWAQTWIADMIRLIPGGKIDRLTMDLSGMILVWGALLIAASWELGSKRKLMWLALSLTFLYASAQLYTEIKIPTKELIVYQGKKSTMLDLSLIGDVYSWNEAVEASEISYSVDPNRVQRTWAQLPKSLRAIKQDSGQLEFIGTDFVFYPNEKQLYFSSLPKSIGYWTEGKWVDQKVSSSLVVDSLAYRIVF